MYPPSEVGPASKRKFAILFACKPQYIREFSECSQHLLEYLFILAEKLCLHLSHTIFANLLRTRDLLTEV